MKPGSTTESIIAHRSREATLLPLGVDVFNQLNFLAVIQNITANYRTTGWKQSDISRVYLELKNATQCALVLIKILHANSCAKASQVTCYHYITESPGFQSYQHSQKNHLSIPTYVEDPALSTLATLPGILPVFVSVTKNYTTPNVCYFKSSSQFWFISNISFIYGYLLLL